MVILYFQTNFFLSDELLDPYLVGLTFEPKASVKVRTNHGQVVLSQPYPKSSTNNLAYHTEARKIYVFTKTVQTAALLCQF